MNTIILVIYLCQANPMPVPCRAPESNIVVERFGLPGKETDCSDTEIVENKFI